MDSDKINKVLKLKRGKMKPKCSIIANPEGGAWEFAREAYKWVIKREADARLEKREEVVKGLESGIHEEVAKGQEKRIHKDCQVLRSVVQLLDSDLESESRYELNQVNVKVFPDGEAKPQIRDNVREKICFFIHDSSLEPNKWFTQLALVNNIMKNSSACEVNDVLPYLKFSKQDRKDESRVSVSAAVVTNSLKEYAKRVITVDVHNPAIQVGYDVAGVAFDNLYSFPLVVGKLREKLGEEVFDNLIIASPDEGAARRASAYAKRMGKGMVICYKRKSNDGNIEKHYVLEDAEVRIKGKTALIIDDQIASGKTQLACAKSLREKGAKRVMSNCSLGLFTEGIEKLVDEKEGLDLIVVGDIVNVPYKHDKLVVIPYAPLIGEAIYRVSEGISLSELFDRDDFNF